MATTSQPIIQIIDLHKSFGSHEVLSGITLDVPAGSTLVILGGSGSGKTVLMKHMIGLLNRLRGGRLQRMDHKIGRGSALHLCCTLDEHMQVVTDPSLQSCRLRLHRSGLDRAVGSNSGSCSHVVSPEDRTNCTAICRIDATKDDYRSKG
jgi:ABC-type molybdenum transport system ATPase subunit/photorepair protein PhrA